MPAACMQPGGRQVHTSAPRLLEGGVAAALACCIPRGSRTPAVWWAQGSRSTRVHALAGARGSRCRPVGRGAHCEGGRRLLRGAAADDLLGLLLGEAHALARRLLQGVHHLLAGRPGLERLRAARQGRWPCSAPAVWGLQRRARGAPQWCARPSRAGLSAPAAARSGGHRTCWTCCSKAMLARLVCTSPTSAWDMPSTSLSWPILLKSTSSLSYLTARAGRRQRHRGVATRAPLARQEFSLGRSRGQGAGLTLADHAQGVAAPPRCSG